MNSTGVFSQKPLFEAFRIGAWWYTKLLKRKGGNYVVYFEGYGKHEEQELTSNYIRLRSRTAGSSDCSCLTVGADVVAFVVHPHSFRAGSNRSCYSAWYDVKIISKVYKHPLYTCACKYKVQFYSDLSKNTEPRSTRALLEGAMVEVSISEIAIMQANLESSLETLFETSLSLAEDSIKRQWSKDTYTLNLSYSSQQPLYSTSVTEDARNVLPTADRDTYMIDVTENLRTDVRLDGSPGFHMLENNITARSKDARASQVLSNQRKSVNSAKSVDLTLSDNLSVHVNNAFTQEVCLPHRAAFESCKTRIRISLPRKAKVTDTGVYAETGRQKKLARHTIFNNQSSLNSSEKSCSSYKLSSSGSDSEELHDSERLSRKEETTDDSQSRTTPVFYGDANESQEIVNSLELDNRNHSEDHGRSTSTKTFYGNPAEKSGQSSSTAIFYGSCGNEEDTLNSTKASKIDVEGQDECLSAKIPHIEHENVDVDCAWTTSKKRDPAQGHEFDDRSECFCNTVQISSDNSESVCRACNFLQGDDSIVMTTPANSQGEDKKAQVVAAKSTGCKNVEDIHGNCSESDSTQQFRVLKKVKKNEGYNKQKHKLRPHATKKAKTGAHDVSHTSHSRDINSCKNVQGRHEYCSESEPVQQSKVLKKRKKSAVDYQQRCKSVPPATTKRKNSARCVSRNPHNRDRAKNLKTQEWKRNFNDLFDAILKSDRELTHVKMAAPLEKPFSFLEEIQNQVPWDPIVFCERTGVYKDDLMEDEPLKDLWKDMELASEEMRGVAALAEQPIQTSQDKALGCEHALVLREQEGYVCSLCGVLVTSVENIFPPVLREEVDHRGRDNQIRAEKEVDSAACNNSTEYSNTPRRPSEPDMGSVWKLIQDLRPRMQKNQVDGFNFLWNNVGALSSQTDNKGGGCIVAHAPGTGKSLLIISFLKSFLQLHSWCRPLIVAPKNMLLSWKKEFEKWQAGIKVYLLQASSPLKYLSGISEWQKSKSVLIVNYQLFSQLVAEGRVCRALEIQRIGSLLLHVPDILVLDEGHVPRNCSKLRESLLQIRTKFKILVSGTLFQNNMQELFNLLYLARPNFLRYLQTRHSNKRFEGIDLDNDCSKKQWQTFEEFNKERQTDTSDEEAELRKIFMEEIGNKLEGKVQEAGGDDDFRHAIEQLQAIMAPFVHFYNGDILKSLPGIKEFIVVLQATNLQVSLSTQIKQQTFLETALSIHPSLLLKWKGEIRTFVELDELQAIRGDASQGPKVKFILDLAECCHLLKEKLLIFSQFIKTMELVAELLPKKFKVAMIKGQDRLEERQRTIEEFNESGGTSILLASLTACGEGINLTGASRVVFLDMHWNPARMKQAVARAFRIGQTRVVHTYWLIASVEKEAEKFTRIHRKDWLSRSIFSLGKEFVNCGYKESHPNSEVDDYVLAQLLRNDMTKSILRVLNYSASEREKPFSIF
ncbi:hypothetical protein GOP47_0018030 [Adiantum capillus-veneris]|uniref:Uncharacterized protein n=1 Tax=Adiantum capillus-veneris TaxID=13818 RepID=A0A9D4UH05_ADICA|nr:hypothetical protein GOP47_0018030 [Adiantum capillus-veneris]